MADNLVAYEGIAENRSLDLAAQVDELLEFEDAIKGYRPHTPRRFVSAMYGIQLARAKSHERGITVAGTPIRPDRLDFVQGAMWWLVPPDER